MAAYGRGKSRATKKRVARGTVEPEAKKPKRKPRTKRLTGKSTATVKRGAKRASPKVGAKRTTAAPKRTSARKAAKPRAKVVAKRPKVAKRPAKAAAKKPAVKKRAAGRKSTAVRKTSSVRKVRGTRKSTAKPKATARPKKAAARPKKAPSRPKAASKKAASRTKQVRKPAKQTALQKARAVAKALRAKLARLEAARQKARRTGAKKPKPKTTKAKVRSGLKKTEKARNEALVKAEALRQGANAKTKAEKRNLADDLHERRKPKFKGMLEHAKRTNQLPEVDYRKRRIDSLQNHGEVRVLRIERLVNEASVEPILDKVRWAVEGMSHAFGIWQTVLVFAAMGERLVGYGQRTLTMNDPDAAAFQTQGIEPTGVFNTPTKMLAKVEEILVDLASEERTVIWCQHIKVMNFSRKQGW